MLRTPLGTRLKLAGAVSAAVLVLAGGVAASGALSASGNRGVLARASHGRLARRAGHRHGPDLVYRSQHHKITPALVRHFAIFRRARRAHPAGDQAQAAGFPGVGPDAVSAYGLDVSAATSVPNSAGLSLWVVPGSGGACLVWSVEVSSRIGGSVSSCAPTEMVLAGQLISASVGSGETVIGLAPDGNSNVSVASQSGSADVAVADNVWAATTSQKFTSVAVDDSAGVTHTYAVPG
jgi:hypothetical protein